MGMRASTITFFLVVAAAVVEAVAELHLAYPRVGSEKLKELRAMRAMLSREH